ncbi:MAG: ATP-binding cassette domain-containing protein, partial [Rhizobiaceae bacterium]
LMVDRCVARAETEVVDGLRRSIFASLKTMDTTGLSARPAGALVAGLQRYPEALAGLVIGHKVARLMLAAGPLITVAALAFVSWQAALALLLATPVMVMFFVLVGGLIHDRADAQERAFGRLASQFSDRIRTLPTILANHVLEREHAKLERRMRDYAGSTLKVLSIAFLNAGIIDFFASISIAILAVFLGLGHLGLVHIPGFDRLELWQSLFILMLAPEFFAPFRRYAEQYHQKAEGDAAAKALDWYFEQGEAAGQSVKEATATHSVVLPHVGKKISVSLPSRGLVTLTGPSGSGKTTLLKLLAGVDGAATGFGADEEETVSWISADIYVPGGRLEDALAWRCSTTDKAAVNRAADRVGLLDDALLPGGLDAIVEEGGTNLSGGQRLRVGIARMLLADGPVFADEPTAKLDPRTASLVRDALRNAAADRLVIVATHDPELMRIARHTIDLGVEKTMREMAAA